MAFCGQCGLQLPPGKTACPRCGTPTEPEFDLVAEDPHENDPTLAALSNYDPPYQRPVGASGSLQQQKLVLRPEGNGHDFSSLAVNDPTSEMSAADYANHPAYIQPSAIPPSNQYMNASYPDFRSQADMGYQPAASQYGTTPAQAPARKGKGRIVALLLILLGLLIILGTLAVLVLKPKGLPGSNTTSNTGSNTTSTTPTSSTASQQAQAVISQYYDDINVQDYQSAYNLWSVNPAPYDQFAAGYANTKHDDITFDNITPLANGTVKVAITIYAQEQNKHGAVIQHVYQGYYIVGQQNGIWKIFRGNFRRTG